MPWVDGPALRAYTSGMSGPVSVPLEEAVYLRARRLRAVRDAAAEAFGGRRMAGPEPGDFRACLRLVRQVLGSIPGAHGTLVGGLAVQELGYVRWTEDVDLVVDAAHYAAILAALRAAGFTLQADLTLLHASTGTVLDLIKEGQVLKDARLPVPHPADLGPHLGFATLAGLVRMKLDSGGRLKDLADLAELLKPHLPKAEAIGSALPVELRADFQALVERARREVGG